MSADTGEAIVTLGFFVAAAAFAIPAWLVKLSDERNFFWRFATQGALVVFFASAGAQPHTAIIWRIAIYFAMCVAISRCSKWYRSWAKLRDLRLEWQARFGR